MAACWALGAKLMLAVQCIHRMRRTMTDSCMAPICIRHCPKLACLHAALLRTRDSIFQSPHASQLQTEEEEELAHAKKHLRTIHRSAATINGLQ